MKKRILVKKLKKANFKLERHGSKHDIFIRINDDGSIDIEEVPRHREVNEELARAILRKWGIK